LKSELVALVPSKATKPAARANRQKAGAAGPGPLKLIPRW